MAMEFIKTAHTAAQTSSQYSPALSDTASQTSESTSYPGPELIFDLAIMAQHVSAFTQALPRVRPHYAVKANPHPEVLQCLKQLGVRFEIASLGELHALQKLGVQGQDMIFSNPIKTPESIRAAAAHQIQWYAFDCLEELERLKQFAPDGSYELRIMTDDGDSVWPLNSKFGADPQTSEELLRYAADNHLDVAGIAFHVGSQCLNPNSWNKAVQRALRLFQRMEELHLCPRLINLGGGFPTPISQDVPTMKELGIQLRPLLDSIPPHIDIVAEPGRYLVAAAGTLHCQIISTTRRQQQPWAYLDCGYYSGLIEMNEAFGFQLRSERKGPTQDWVIAGPTCDALDRFTPLYQLPIDSQAGDRVSIAHTGAYCNSCACEFNGFPAPRVRIVDSRDSTFCLAGHRLGEETNQHADMPI
ncbi:type III PLP-dependent enzyme [Pseudomaricurvus sp.]|uniref:type III PLP-dependent enzyme n=1 Tax=Pseudomaricurvus sp. TaxID=2004510 RepID=UPI003F6D7ACB